ncbi:hypothetical protein [Sphingomonas sp.]|uniref:hypothetical protein n=1 Tax=Sphingomonas sp. TaxID=28214 RepID=UPI00262FB967|nr:hypothetical protein [Sphingomonas sp.]
MASLQHVYRRDHIFWWRRVHYSFHTKPVDVRLSLGTPDRRQARNRGAALTASYDRVVAMMNERLRVEPALTEKEIQRIARAMYEERLMELCYEQRLSPGDADLHSAANLAFVDYFERQARNGGDMSFLDGETEWLRSRGWDDRRIEDLKLIISLREDRGIDPIRRNDIDRHLNGAGFSVTAERRHMIELALYPAFRDAFRDAELQRIVEAGGSRVTLKPTLEIAPEPDEAVNGEYLDIFIEEAIDDQVADGKWAEKSGRQARSTIALFNLLVGRKKLGQYTQADIAAFKRKLRFVPGRYDMTSWGSREKILANVAAGERCSEANGKGKPGQGELSSRTRNRHLSSLASVFRWGAINGKGQSPVNFKGVFVAENKLKRARSERPATPKDDVSLLFGLPIWTGSQDHQGGTGRAVLRARFTPGDVIVQDAFYWVPLLLYYTGARREEICKLRPTDVRLDPAPHIFIDFTEFGRIKNDQSVRPVPLHRELIRLGFLGFVEECRARGYDVLFPELRPTNSVQNFGDVYYRNVWSNIKKSINPNTKTLPVFRAREDATMTTRIYKRVPVLIDEARGSAGNAWEMRFMRMFDMAGDSSLFRTSRQLADDGWQPAGTLWNPPAGRDHESMQVPLFEAKMLHQFNHRYADYALAEEKIGVEHREIPHADAVTLADPAYEVTPRYWVPQSAVQAAYSEKEWSRDWAIGWRDITNATNQRTLVACVAPAYAYNDKFLIALSRNNANQQAALYGNLNTLVLDFVARQKLGGTSLKYFVFRQLPILPPPHRLHRSRPRLHRPARAGADLYQPCHGPLRARSGV